MADGRLSTLIGVVAGAGLALAASEAGLQKLAPPPPPIMEVDDGIAAYVRGDPDIVVLGSSHTRSFTPVRDTLARETSGALQTALVPVEWGTFFSYQWVLDNRVRPLIEERDSAARPVRTRLSRAILVTTFYDMCSREYAGTAANLPARAWTAKHFFEDASQSGVNDFNRNYLQTRYKTILWFSSLAKDRGDGRIFDRVTDRLHRLDPDEVERRREERIAEARTVMEKQYQYCDDPREKAALEEMIDYFDRQNVEVTVVLFPLMPAIVSQTSKETTVKRYTDYVNALAAKLPIRVVDMTLGSPLLDSDFQADLDHVSITGNQKFAAWALDSGLSYLRQPREHLSAGVAPIR